MNTTIKIKQDVKANLDQIKKESESYSDAIARLIQKEEKKRMEEDMIKGYSKVDMEEFEEWESANL